MPVTKVLDRLERVKPTGPGRWIARCPAHEDRSPSLSIRELDDGRVLINDFGGCEVGSVLAALGLEMRDLYPKPLKGTGPADGYARSHSRIPAIDLLQIISEEVSVVVIVANDMLEKRSISDNDWRILARAAARIRKTRDHVR
jgi:hypothetical protein